MDVCGERTPSLATPARDQVSGRLVACWLHDQASPAQSIPPALAAELSLGGTR
jgi:hypothetical protein